MTEGITGEKKEPQVEDSTKQIVQKAAQAVGSLKETEFDIRFNPDVFSPGVVHPKDQGQLKKECQLVQDAADFLITVQIPAFIRDCLDHSTAPMDGQTLADAIHNRGINMRYLGKITEMLAKVPQLEYVHVIGVTEVVIRSAKHLFTHYLQGMDMLSLAGSVSHFMNCLLSSCPTPSAVVPDQMHKKRSRNKSKKSAKQSPLAPSDSVEWASLTPKTLWAQIRQEAKSYFNWTLEQDNVDSLVEAFNVNKATLLRSFCQKTGVQILLREYQFDNKSVQSFTEDGYELISEALNLLNNVYGAMHPEIAQCLRMLARLNYIMGDHVEAMSCQQKAVLMSERVNGIDHPYTITEYTHLALYCFANTQVSTALKLLYRARYLALLVTGENHPELALIDSNIGLILHAVGEYDISLRFLEKALQLNIKYHGVKSLKVAVSYHLVARTQSCMGDFRSALTNEKETFTIYKSQLGDEHDKTKESGECLRHLTQL